MSVLRQNASDDEFIRTIDLRLSSSDRQFHGVASFTCEAVRNLQATTSSDRRQIGDRLYCVLDTDAEGRPNHADVFATVPRPSDAIALKTAFRRQRHRLMELLRQDFVGPNGFRDGALNRNRTGHTHTRPRIISPM
jgi:hypothetical protein